jgi:hypothetical protein
MKNYTNRIEKLVNETNDNYNLRLMYIELNKPKNNDDLNLLIMYSKIFINIIKLGCRYNKKIELMFNKNNNKIKQLLNKKK